MNSKYGINNIKELFLVLLPSQIFVYLTSSLSGIVNGIVVGNYLSSLDMIALGFANPIVMIISVSSVIISSGARILCGKFIGKGEKKKINETFSTAIISLLFFGIILTIILLIFTKPVVSFFGVSSQALEKTCLYICGVSIGIIPTIISPCLMVFLEMQNETSRALTATVLLAIFNFVLGVGAMKYINASIFAVGLATSLSQYLVLVFLIIRFIKNKHLARLTKIEDKSLFKETLLLGLPSALAQVLYATRNSILNVIANDTFGSSAVNALSILTSSSGPLDAFNVGVGSTQLILASVYIGEKDKEAIKTLSRQSLLYGMFIATMKIAIVFLFADKIALFFGANEEVLKITIGLYRHYALSFPLNIITTIIVNTHQAFGRITICNISYIIGALVAPITVVKVLGNVIGINGAWAAFWIAEIIQITMLYVVACIMQKKLITKPYDVLMVEKNIQVDDAIVISIKEMNEAIEVSKKIQDYCLSKNIDKKRSMIAGLCCEEIATNIIDHGFTKTKKKNKSIDIYANVEDDTIYIRIKDNAAAFDPHSKIYESDDPTVNIGIRMVSKFSKEMYYQNTFGLNVLSITI